MEGDPPHEGADHVMVVVVSSAFPKFSTMNHALAALPGRPTPCDALRPWGPVKSTPRVRNTSNGSSKLTLTVESLPRVRRSETTPEASPSSPSGTPTSKDTVRGVWGTSSNVIG